VEHSDDGICMISSLVCCFIVDYVAGKFINAIQVNLVLVHIKIVLCICLGPENKFNTVTCGKCHKPGKCAVIHTSCTCQGNILCLILLFCLLDFGVI
jgi:hypothetical protein